MKEKKESKNEIEKLMAGLARNIQDPQPKVSSLRTKSQNGMMSARTTKRSEETAEREAQELIYDAWEAGRKSDRIRLARKALAIYPDCADAYNLLARDTAKSLEETKEYFKKGMEAGRRTLGEKTFKEMKGHFWGFLETRPYMRARAGLMQCLWDAGDHDAAIHHAHEMLELNPNDNQGIRYLLITYLAGLGRYDELDTFMNKGGYKNDCAAEWRFTRVLLSFVKKGNTEASRRELKNALKINRYVPDYLSGKKPIPSILPDSIMWGGEDEAFCYASANIGTWQNVSGALEWMEDQLKITKGKKS